MILVTLAGCAGTHQDGSQSLAEGVTEGACPAEIPAGTFSCTASRAAVGNRYDCCGGSLPTRSCAVGLECHTPVAGGVGICLGSDWSKAEPASVCIGGPEDCLLPLAYVPAVPVPTTCDAATRCGGVSYRLECDPAACFCFVDGKKSGPFPSGDTCATEKSTATAIGRLCSAPEEATSTWLH